jgi:hypothetical protein
MTWGSRRKLLYGGFLCLFVAIFLLIKIYPLLNKEPTCLDGKKNGAERGVDCGGGCTRICQNDTAPLTVKWSRSFKVGNGIYSAFSYVENQNVQASGRVIYYEFNLYDEENIFIVSRKGATYIPPNGRFGIFETAIATGQRIPKNTSFKFLTQPQWEKVTAEEARQFVFSEASIPTNLDIAPRLSVSVENPTITTAYNIDVFAVIYDAEGNALGVSKTLVDKLPAGGNKNLTFTWREPFAGEPRRTEILTQLNVFENRLQQ